MITIGKMSQACHLSIKTLRWYDRIGLLQPDHVDENTGFRYYSTSQIDRAVLIIRYKRFGFSLDEIACLLESDEAQQRELLTRQKTKLDQQAEDLRQTVMEIDEILKREPGRTIMSENIEIITTPKTPVYAVRSRMGVQDFGTAFGKLFESVARDHLIPAGPVGARYYDESFDPENADVEVFIPVQDPSQANESIGGGECAHLIHKGSYSTLSDAYAALVKWIEENGYQIIAAPYEWYLVSGHENPDPKTWKTELFFPVAKK